MMIMMEQIQDGGGIEDVPGFDFTSRTTLQHYNIADQWLT